MGVSRRCHPPDYAMVQDSGDPLVANAARQLGIWQEEIQANAKEFVSQ
jgi:hypothetical protein